MNCIKSLFALMLVISLGYSWTAGYSPPSCLTQYSVVGANFTMMQSNQSIPCSADAIVPYGTVFVDTTFGIDAWEYGYHNATNIKLSSANNGSTLGGSIDVSYYGLPDSGSYNGSMVQGTNLGAFLSCSGNISKHFSADSNFTLTKQGAEWQFNNGTGTLNCNTSESVVLHLGSVDIGQSSNIIYYPRYNSSSQRGLFLYPTVYNSSISYPLSNTFYATTGRPFGTNGYIMLSDFKTSSIIQNVSSTASYCKALLYFNNPYYGNIQLLPKITYFPGTDAFPYFYNSTSNVVFLLNNSISYVYDSITNGWYIVPATICSDYTTISSVSTLQYNPTGLTTGSTGTIPISVSSISGSCSFASPLITCTGTDTSGTLTSLTLSAYALGNSTAACSNIASGSSATLTCTLPSVNGTYSAFFYGTDANQLNYLIASNSYTIGSSTTLFGRDGYLAALLIVVVAATVMTNSIAVSMVLACFGLFVSVAFGVVPIETASVASLFTVVAFALSYRLKV